MTGEIARRLVDKRRSDVADEEMEMAVRRKVLGILGGWRTCLEVYVERRYGLELLDWCGQNDANVSRMTADN